MFYACLILPGLVEFRSNSVSISGCQILAGNWAAKMRPDTHAYTNACLALLSLFQRAHHHTVQGTGNNYFPI